ncbi:HIT family hydrolase [Aurantimonas sp. Leaf443]|nr:HIT family hydrolase [Aurantimonas sp. Leaf443]
MAGDGDVTSYDDGNIFAKILRGEIPSQTVHEDDVALVIMDVMPQVDGHCLVIPKAPSRNLLDASPETLSQLLPLVARVARAAKAAFGADGVRIAQFNETAAGQTVFHLHVHVMPMREGVAPRAHSGAMADPELLAEHARRLREALATA